MSDSQDPQFVERVQSFYNSIRQEFDAIESGDHEAVIFTAKKKIASAILQLTDELLGLAKTADSEQAKLGAIKFAFEMLVGKDGKAAGQQTIGDLIKELTKADE